VSWPPYKLIITKLCTYKHRTI